MAFLPVSKQDMLSLGWYYYDFLLVTGDAYVDHPSFGAAIISRVLEDAGFRVAVLSQPYYRDARDFEAFGAPRRAVLITAGNVDSLVANYTAAKKRRSDDAYSPGGRGGRRPDYACSVYSRLSRQAFADTPIILGGLEASLRRFSHYDYWSDSVMPSILEPSGADIVVYGMGERALREIAARLEKKEPVSCITDIRGTAFMSENIPEGAVLCPSFEEAASSKKKYALAAQLQVREQDPVRGMALAQGHGSRYLVQLPPAMPLSRAEFDAVYSLPYERAYHPSYEPRGGVPAISEVRFSIIHNRGCFGGCNFCSLAFHQGRMVTSRSHDSVISEAKRIIAEPDFKGYIHDVGGPTANFRAPSCKKQLRHGLCPDKNCLAPEPCKSLEVSHADYLALLRKLRALEGVKKVFIRSGIRFDYLMQDKNGDFFSELVRHHVSGQLKVAPEHCSDDALYYMQKPPFEVYRRFEERFAALTKRCGKEQYLVPYLISSHPGCTLQSAVELAEYLSRSGRHPEQVQDFYPTPGTVSTCMYYSGFDPRTMERVFVPRSEEEKAAQRALLQWSRPQNRGIVIAALKKAGREDLIGFKKGCLIRPMAKKRPNPKASKNSPEMRLKKRGR